VLGRLGYPNDYDRDGSICGAIAVGVNMLYQRQTRFSAQPHVLQVLEQYQSSQHGRLDRYGHR